jgi:putative Holliday junction resolvase
MSPPGAATGAPQIILAFDFGARRIGVASGDTLTGTARALTALQCNPDIPWAQIDKLVAEYRPQQFVVGLPYNMDGTPTLLTKASRRFAHELKSRYAQPTALVDERLSSREASEQLRDARARGLKRRRTTREDIDMVAARILLERWFDDPAAAQEV